jgi:hypothetical protein
VEGKLAGLRSFFEKRPEVAAACLFGSAATGRLGPLSDLDIGVLIARSEIGRLSVSLDYQAELLTELMRVLKSNDVDLVLLHEAPPLLAHRVLRDGIFFFVADPAALADFRFHALQRYLDTRMIREVQAKALAGRIQSGRFAQGHR